MQNYQTCPRESIECVGDQILYTEDAGTIQLDPETHDSLTDIQLKYVPGLTSNLLSVSTISKSNLITVFKDNYGGVFRKEDVIIKGKPILKALEHNGTYKVNLNISKNNVALRASLSNKMYSLWLKRFGRVGVNRLNSLKNGLVDGITQTITSGADLCQICLDSKQTRTPLPTGGVKRGTKLLEIIHSDVCEVTDTLSWEGYRYFVTFIDDKSRYTMIAFLRKKNEVFEKFKSC